MFIAGPRTAGHSPHHIPKHRRTKDFVYSQAPVTHHTETSVDSFANANSASVVQSYQAHAPGTIPGKTLYGHIGHYIAAIFDIRGFTEG